MSKVIAYGEEARKSLQAGIVLLHRERKEGINKRAFAIVAQAPNGKNGVVTMQYNSENQQFEIADTCEKL